MIIYRPEHEGRYRIVRLPPKALIEMLNWQRDSAALALPILTTLPVGYEILEIHYEADRRSWALTVYHSTFDSVPDGYMIPEFESGWTAWRQVEIRRIDKNDAGPIIIEVVSGGN